MDKREPYRPIGDNPDPQEQPQVINPSEAPSPANNPDPDDTPLVHVADDNPAHDASAAPDD